MERLRRLAGQFPPSSTAAAAAEPASPPPIAQLKGQAFSVSRVDEAEWADGLRPYFQYRDLGIINATNAKFRAHLLRVRDTAAQEGPITMGHHTTGLHQHEVSFQMNFILQGHMKFVYEGEGEHTFRAGDCWLQPAGIVHNELECSEDLIDLEVTAPGIFETTPLEEMKGSPATAQRFSVSRATEAEWTDGLRPYFEYRDLGIAGATNGAFKAHLLRVKASEGGTHDGSIKMGEPTSAHTTGLHRHGDPASGYLDFQMNFVLQGWMRFEFEGHGVHTFRAGDCWLQPAGIVHNELACSDDLLNLEVTSPAMFPTTPVDSEHAAQAKARASAAAASASG